MRAGRRSSRIFGHSINFIVLSALVVSGLSPARHAGALRSPSALNLNHSLRPGFQAESGHLGHRFPLSTRPSRGHSDVFTQLYLHPNIETIGVVASGPSLPRTAELFYRPRGEDLWQAGHPLVRIDDGRLAGSLFGLSPASAYEIRVRTGAAEISGSISTQPEELEFTPSAVIHVDDDALPGGDGSAGSPFRTIQQGVNNAAPGTQVLVADGTYQEAVTFPASGAPGQWIQVKAAGGAAILDGSQELKGNIWSRHPTNRRVWFTRINAPLRYLARDGERFYLFDERSGLMQGRGHEGVFIDEGWYFERSTLRLYVRSETDPSTHTWQAPQLNLAFHVDGRNWIWIEGFEIRFYGAGSSGCGVCTINASHIVIRRNIIHNMHLGVFVNWTSGAERGNNTRIEYNEISDPTAADWPWRAVKGTSMEGSGIIVRGHIGAIVRGNEVFEHFNGIFTGSSALMGYSEIAFDTDIYHNYIHHIRDDGLEPEGSCVNHRFRNNTVDAMLVGISIAPVTQGPVWVLRSTFTNYSGSAIKWDRDPDGAVFVYHNTAWTNADGPPGMQMISPVHNSVLRNNIFQSNGYAFESIPIGSTGNDWDNDNWHTTRGAGSPHFKWENLEYVSIEALCAAAALECSGYEDAPEFVDPLRGDFTLLPSSPNLDRGVLIPGINDQFHGSAPDVGAFEHGPALPP